MKKLKILIVTLLSLILCMMCAMSTTFSWFTRPQSLSGSALDFNDTYDTSVVNNEISMVTYESTDDGLTFGENAVTSFSNSTGIAAGARKYYRTDIINTSKYDQSVSLYLSDMALSSTSKGNFYLGVNKPLRTYKQYGVQLGGSGKVASAINKQNVYLALDQEEVDGGKLKDNIDYLHTWGSPEGDYDTYYNTMVDEGTTGEYTDSSGWKTKRKYYIYSVPIDSRSTHMKLKAHSGGDNGDGWIGGDTKISDNNTLIFYEYGGNYYTDARKSGTPAKLQSFYSSATVEKGSAINIAATASGEYVEYTSSNVNVAKVDNNGNVTGVATGAATITVKVYGVYGDCLEASCTVNVTSSDNSMEALPVVTNVRVPKGEGTEEGKSVESIYWYIKNDSTTGPLKYTITDLYVTL